MVTEKITWSAITKMILELLPEVFITARNTAITFYKEEKNKQALKEAFEKAVTNKKPFGWIFKENHHASFIVYFLCLVMLCSPKNSQNVTNF